MTESGEVIWSKYTRFIHWTVATIVLLNAFVLEEGDPPHRYLGYVAVALVILRGIIGFKGMKYERFSNFPIGEWKEFLQTHFKRTHHYIGHNPLASLTYFFVWGCILVLGLTGWMMGLDAFFGDDTLEEIHIYASNSLLFLVAVHLVGIAVDSILYKKKTWLAMITGK